MAQGLPGADSSQLVTADLIDATTAHYGATPVFWGRYFTSVTTTGNVEYRHARENGPLNRAGIKLLPIGRQTARVHGTRQDGINDGVNNAKDFITTFGASFLAAQGGEFFMFLDVEGAPSLSSGYYTGWAQGLAQESVTHTGVAILPCVYATQGDGTTWSALATACDAGAVCRGVWIARYDPNDCTLGEWNDDTVTPVSPAPFPWPILAWQYCGNCLNGKIDCSQTNPTIDPEQDLLKFLILPPASAPST
jgi:hypothetical protein